MSTTEDNHKQREVGDEKSSFNYISVFACGYHNDYFDRFVYLRGCRFSAV